MTVFVKENQTVAQDTDRSATFFFLVMTRAVCGTNLRSQDHRYHDNPIL